MAVVPHAVLLAVVQNVAARFLLVGLAIATERAPAIVNSVALVFESLQARRDHHEKFVVNEVDFLSS